MSRRHFTWLFALTVLVAVIIGFLPERTGRESAFEVQPLLPDLAQGINDVTEIRVVRGGEAPVATLHRGETGWTVAEADGYPADWPRLRTLLAALAQARVVEPKTANPEYFDRLGLRDVTDPESSALRVQLGAGEKAPAVLVGEAAQDRDGQYVRLAGEGRAWLIDRALDVPGETRDWLDRQIIDVPETDVVEFSITHPDGEQIVLRKVSADDADFVLQDVPEGRAAQDSWTLNATAGGFAGLRLDEVRRADRVAFEDAVRVRAMAADGLAVAAELAAAEEKFWIRLEASVEQPSPAPDAGAPGDTAIGGEEDEESAPGNDTEGDAQASDEDAEVADAKPEDRAAEINRRVSGWAYAIPQYKYDVLTRRMSDLLKPEEKAD